MKHAAEVAQVIINSKQQAPSLAHKPVNAAAAVAAAEAGNSLVSPVAPTPDVLLPSSSSGLVVGPAISATAASPSQPGASTAVGLLATAGGQLAIGATDTTNAAAQASSSLPAAAVVADITSAIDPQSHLQEQLQQQSEVQAQTILHIQPVSTIKPKNLKPITIARGSSAFSMGQPKRPALLQGLSQPQPLHVTPTPFPAPELSPHPAVSQAAALSQQAPLVSDVRAPLVNADSEAQAEAVLGLVTAAPSTSVLPATTATGQPSMAEPQNPSAMGHAVTAQPRAIPQIRAAPGGLFGAAMQPRVAALSLQGISTVPSGLAGTSPMEPDLAAVSRLRAQLTLPFALAPAEGQPAVSKAGKRQQPEGQNSLGEASVIDGKGQEGSAAGGIRAVVDALQAEEPCDDADAVQPPGKKQKKGSTASFSMLHSCFAPD